MCKHKYARGVWGYAPPDKSFKLGALRSHLRSYLNSNATSPTRVHGRSNTAILYDTHQSSRGVSVTIVNLVCVGPDDVGMLSTNGRPGQQQFLLCTSL